VNEPELVPGDALRGAAIGISVSDSADLMRLGLTPAHCDLAVAELARAIFIAGGTIVYGGRLIPAGFTDVLIEELRRYRDDRDALVLCVPETEHRRLSNDELRRREQELHSSAELVCLDMAGEPVDIANRPADSGTTDPGGALTAMRQYITGRCDARALVGGRLRGYQGAMPGVIEEAVMSIKASQSLYVAGGFGGAACAVASALGYGDNAWFPPGFPEGVEDHVDLLSDLSEIARSSNIAGDGLSSTERQQLAASHRPGDIASLVVTGLGRRAG
jgi:SLOG cluster2